MIDGFVELKGRGVWGDEDEDDDDEDHKNNNEKKEGRRYGGNENQEIRLTQG